MEPVLLASDITKSYGGTDALRSVQFGLFPGEVHALIGENGAGKSTLARILAGSVRADSGDIFVDGQRTSITQTMDAQRLGIGIIYQELDLFPHLTVGENIVIGNLGYPERGIVSRRRIERFCLPFLQQVGLYIDSSRWVASLSIAQQQLVAIARALSMNCRILLMDEPTSALSEDAAERLFNLIAVLKARSVSFVYVSHKMDEILRLSDRITVLRDGQTIGTRERAATNREELIRMMVGRNVDPLPQSRRPISSPVVLSVANLTTHKLKDVSFDLREGEVLGISGLVGAGRSELAAALFGLDRINQGVLRLKGQPYRPNGPSHARSCGIGLVPEDRKVQGLMSQMSVQENSTLLVLSRLSQWGVLRASREDDLYRQTATRLRLKCASAHVPVGTLSGGNQQKALVARWLLCDPSILLLDDPCRGIDEGAKEDIYRLIRGFVASGKSVLLASSELRELVRCSNRILVLNNGCVAAVLEVSEATQEGILTAATHTPPCSSESSARMSP